VPAARIDEHPADLARRPAGMNEPGWHRHGTRARTIYRPQGVVREQSCLNVSPRQIGYGSEPSTVYLELIRADECISEVQVCVSALGK